MFYRDSETLLWDLVNYQLLDLGRPVHCVRCAAVAPGQGGQWNLWAGHRNKIHIINPTELKIIVSSIIADYFAQCYLHRSL